MIPLPTFFLAVTLVLSPGIRAASAPSLAPVDSPELIEKLLDEYDSRAAFVAAVADAEQRGASVGLIVKAHLLSGLREYDASLLRIALARAAKAERVRCGNQSGRGARENSPCATANTAAKRS